MLSENYIIDLIIESRGNKLDAIKQSILDEWSNDNPYLRKSLDKAIDEIDNIAAFTYIDMKKPDWDTILFRSKRRKLLQYAKVASKYAAAILVLITITILFKNSDSLNLSSIFSREMAISEKDVVIEFSDGSTELATRDIYNLDNNYILTKDSLKISYMNGNSVHPVSVYTPSNKMYKIILPDGSSVWLNANSSINFATKEKKFNRNVTIDGECFFAIAKDINTPFSVKSRLSKVTVLGTKFNVNDRKGEDASITLVSGSVVVECGEQSTKISPGQQLSYSDENNTITIKDVDSHFFSLWKEGLFVFDNITLKEIFAQLSGWYGVKCSVNDFDLQNRKMYAIVKRYQSIDTVLQKLSGTGKFNFKMENEKVMILSKEE